MSRPEPRGRPPMYGANTDARVPRVKSAARILGVAARVDPNLTKTYVEAMQQDAAAQAAAELAQGISGQMVIEGDQEELEGDSQSLAGSDGGIPPTPMPGGFNTWARRGSAASIVSAPGSETGSQAVSIGSRGESESGGSKLYMAPGPGEIRARGRRDLSSYESSFSDAPHPHAYASPPRAGTGGGSNGQSVGAWSRMRSVSTGEQGLPPTSADIGADGARPDFRTDRHHSRPTGGARDASPARISPAHSSSYTSYSSTTPLASMHGSGASPSPAALRHPTTRLLSPDLPPRDALYLFCNFSSYMRSPQEGAEGIRDNTDFGDTIRLLDFARTLAAEPKRNVHILHLKYRFQTPDQGLPMTRTEKLASLGRDADYGGKYNGAGVARTVPQPFSAVKDPVLKINYEDNGVFNPLPAQAVFNHIARTCQPPPRIIVVSYVCSKATENHIASIAHWAQTSAPPIYIFSPLETRLRENRSLEEGLHDAIPISMYAWPLAPASPSAGTTAAATGAPGALSTTPTTAKPRATRSNTDPSSKIYKSPLTRKRHTAGTGSSARSSSQVGTPMTSPPTSPAAAGAMSPLSPLSPMSPISVATTATGGAPSPVAGSFGGSTATSSGASSPTSPSGTGGAGCPKSPRSHRARGLFSPRSPTNTFSRRGRRYTSDTDSHSGISPTSPGASRGSTLSGTGVYTYAPSSLSPRIYPSDPVATLSVVTQDSLTDPGTGELVPDRIPLWALAPGTGVWHGSTAASLGVRLGDFSAVNLAKRDGGSGGGGPKPSMTGVNRGDERRGRAHSQEGQVRMPQSMAADVQLKMQPRGGALLASAEGGSGGIHALDVEGMGIIMSTLNVDAQHGSRTRLTSMPLLDGSKRAGAAGTRTATPEPISRACSAVSIPGLAKKPGANTTAGGAGVRVTQEPPTPTPMTQGSGGSGDGGAPTIHLTPPNQDPRRLSPPDARPARPVITTVLPSDESVVRAEGIDGDSLAHDHGNGKGNGNGNLAPAGGSLTARSWPTPKSWPTLPNKVPGWKRGRREVMEDALEEISAMAATAATATDAGGISISPATGDMTARPLKGFEINVNDDDDAVRAQMGALQVGSVEWEKGDAVLFALRGEAE